MSEIIDDYTTIFAKYKGQLDPNDKFYLNDLFIFFLKTMKLTNIQVAKMSKNSLTHVSYIRTKKFNMTDRFYCTFINGALQYTQEIREQRPSIIDKIIEIINCENDEVTKEDLLYLSKLSEKLHLSRRCVKLFHDKELMVRYRIDYIAFLTFAYNYCAFYEPLHRLLMNELIGECVHEVDSRYR